MSAFSYFIAFIIAILIWCLFGWVFSILDHRYEERKKKEDYLNNGERIN